MEGCPVGTCPAGLTRLWGVVQVLLQEGQRADQVWDSGRVEELSGCKLPRCAAQVEKPWGEVKLSWIWTQDKKSSLVPGSSKGPCCVLFLYL